ncbi:hypothetical protein [Candidatus Parabeggiatoa sp. HSG14]|uniref:hypothetical protein n=1 Tax=Candidatus Parabeggiatoa sp. HSG14 TaxID=3055593 RepID=UPI0025A82AE4|nr:hypothetical protein [Thiotrichales bacterium HSG14]
MHSSLEAICVTSAIKQQVTVQPDGFIKFRSPELKAGLRAEVIVITKELSIQPPGLLLFMGKGKGAFATPEKADAFIRRERDTW